MATHPNQHTHAHTHTNMGARTHNANYSVTLGFVKYHNLKLCLIRI